MSYELLGMVDMYTVGMYIGYTATIFVVAAAIGFLLAKQ